MLNLSVSFASEESQTNLIKYTYKMERNDTSRTENVTSIEVDGTSNGAGVVTQ